MSDGIPGAMTGPAAVLADPVLDWMAEARRLRFSVSGLRSPDLAVARAAARRCSDLLAQRYTARAPSNVVIEDFTVVGRPDRDVWVRRYRPSGVEGLLPTQIWLHGGGFAFGTVEEFVNDWTCAARTAATGVQTLAVEYRLAPEHGYPAQVEDAIAAFDAVVADRRLLSDAARTGIGGNSAGATIAASAALRIRDTRDIPLVHQLLEVPLVIFEPFGASMEEFDLDEGPLGVPRLGEPGGLEGVGTAYLTAGVVDRYTVPLQADLAGLPPTLVMTAEFDPLRDGGEEYVTRLCAAGVPATGNRGEGHLHASSSLTAVWEGSRQWQATAARAMMDAYASTPAS